ncbi:MAG TPA: iron-sulfur cluster repair di-iron protein [Cyclobacteriaceae bacterium]|nr:iron-sulfur cluster repair di-iron protein [Cyclobacteriaceae bacterium]
MTSIILELSESSVADVAIQYPQALGVFHKYNIDFCCGGKRSFRETCVKKGLNADTILDEIVHSKSVGSPTILRFNSWDTAFLVDFIIQNHHAYVKETIPQLRELLDKICSVHGEDHIELPEIRDDFNDLADELLTHMNKEEMFLFPAIKNRAQREVSYVPLDGPISVMEDEHEIAGDLTKSIRQLTKNYTIPRDACPTFQLTYKKLEEFDHDLMQHVHLENNVLFEKLKSIS